MFLPSNMLLLCQSDLSVSDSPRAENLKKRNVDAAHCFLVTSSTAYVKLTLYMQAMTSPQPQLALLLKALPSNITVFHH